MATYSFVDTTDTTIKVVEDSIEIIYKKVYCSTAVDNDNVIFYAHELETGKLRQQYIFDYTDCAAPVAASALLLQVAINAIIENYADAGTVTDGDKGDITVSGSGATWTIDNDVVTFAKMQNIATGRLLGRGTAASGDVEEITPALGTTGTDLTWAFTAGTLTLNVPSASATARGVVTTGTQTMAGAKTWSGAAVFSSTVNISATTTANPFVITSTNATGTTFAISVTANSGSRGMFISTNGQAQCALRSSTHTDREFRFQMFSDGHCYIQQQGLSGAITSDMIFRTSADSGSNAGALRFALSGTNKMAITSAGIAVGSQAGALSASAYLHLMAGTASANTAPLKFTSGTNLTTAVTGAVEYNGTNLFFTRSGTTRESVWCGNSGAAAPATTAAGVLATYHGTGGTVYLSTPNSWGSVVIGGTTYKIALYT